MTLRLQLQIPMLADDRWPQLMVLATHQLEAGFL